MYTLSDTAAQGTSILDFPAPAGSVISGAFDEAVETNPVPLFVLSHELNASRQIGPRLEWWEATDQAKKAGVKVTVPEDGISQAALSILIERRKDEASRSILFARKDGFGASAGAMGAGFAGTLLDPVNAAAGFVPVLGGTRYAAALGNAATVGSRTALRAAVGGAEGLVGAALVEAPTAGLRRDLQDDYSLYDSLANVAFGTFASSGIRAAVGGARDYWRGIRAARQEDFIRSIEPGEWKAARDAYERQIERDISSDLDGGFERGAGPSDGLTDRWATERAAAARHAEITGEADAAIGRMRSRMSDQEIAAFVEGERQLRADSTAMGADDRTLLDATGVAERKFREMDLKEVRDRLAAGEGLVIVPGNEREGAAAVSDETHAAALKTAVGQAVEGRRIDVDPVLRQDPVFGPQRMGAAAVKERARSSMLPENKVGADRKASERATIETEAPAASRGRAEPPPPRGQVPGEAAGAEAKSPDLVEAEKLLAETKARVEAAANEGGFDLPAIAEDVKKKAETYDRAWEAVAACMRGRGI